jgi:hypothetical protein
MPAKYEPTAEQRALVENAAAFGLTQAEIANQLKIDEKTLRKHFREELNSGKFKVDMLAGKTVTELMKSKDERVRLDAAKYYTARGLERDQCQRAGWKGQFQHGCVTSNNMKLLRSQKASRFITSTTLKPFNFLVAFQSRPRLTLSVAEESAAVKKGRRRQSPSRHLTKISAKQAATVWRHGSERPQCTSRLPKVPNRRRFGLEEGAIRRMQVYKSRSHLQNVTEDLFPA